MEVNNEESRLSVAFGHDWVGPAPTHFKLGLVISQTEVKSQVEKLNNLVPGEVWQITALFLSLDVLHITKMPLQKPLRKHLIAFCPYHLSLLVLMFLDSKSQKVLTN